MAGVQVADGKLYWRDMLMRRTAVLLLLIVALLLIALIGSGLLDAKPVGSLQWQQQSLGPMVLTESAQFLWLADLPDGDFTVRVTAVYHSGELDSIYGLVLGSEADSLAVAISPAGYVTLWQGAALLLPLQTWPHVRGGQEANEIWVDVVGGQVTVRLNREILWVGQAAVAGQVGLMGQSFGETAVINFSTMQLFFE